MRLIRDEIKKETRISKKLREYALDAEIEQGKKIREKQNYHYNKIAFLKKLNETILKSKRNEENI